MTVLIDIIILLILILANGFFSLSEFALMSSRKMRLKQMASDGNSGASAALTLVEDQTTFLSSIQIGITLVGICTGAFGGASFSPYLEPLFRTIPIIGEYSEFTSLIFIILVITYFSIVIGELVPKRIGLALPESISCSVSPIFIWITRIATPFSYLTSGLTNIIMKITGITKESSPDHIEEEIHLLLEEGAESGVIDESEQNLVENVFDFGDSLIVDLMIPRPDIIGLNIEDDLKDNLDIMQQARHTRFPVYRGTLDHIVGVVSVRDVWAYTRENQDKDLSAVIQDIVVVPNQINALELIKIFRSATSPVAVIVDEYGSVIGLITLHDLLEALVGDLSGVDHEEESPGIIQREDGSWLVDGRTTPEELFETTRIDCMKEEDKGNFRTIAGFILYETGGIPKEGDVISYEGNRFEIVDMDGHRIDKVLITPGLSNKKPGS